MNSPLSFVFFGTPDVSSETLEILKSRGFVPKLIVTSPDRPVGRHFTMTPSPTKVWADENNIPVLQPEKITDEFIQQLSDSLPLQERDGERFDLFIVVAYGKILPQKLIDLPRLGTLNIHYSLLPRWRGASPVEAAILAGDAETGVSIQRMVFKLDAGPVIAEQKIPIARDDTTPSLRAKLIPTGANLLADLLEQVQESGGKGEAFAAAKSQDETLATHRGKTTKDMGLVDPDNDDPAEMWRKYRAYQPWPGLYFFENGKRVKIIRARFQNGRFVIERIVREGEKETDWNK